MRFYSIDEMVMHLQNINAYVASVDGKPAGYIGYEYKNDNEIELVVIVVLPEFRRKGVGSSLFAHLLALEGRKEITLVTHPENTEAILFYLKHGFFIKGWKDNYFGNGQPRLLLERNGIK